MQYKQVRKESRAICTMPQKKLENQWDSKINAKRRIISKQIDSIDPLKRSCYKLTCIDGGLSCTFRSRTADWRSFQTTINKKKNK